MNRNKTIIRYKITVIYTVTLSTRYILAFKVKYPPLITRKCPISNGTTKPRSSCSTYANVYHCTVKIVI